MGYLKSMIPSLFCMVTLVMSSCAPTSEPEPAPEPEAEADIQQMPAVTPQDVWKYIIEDEPFRDWSTFPLERIQADAVWKDNLLATWVEGHVTSIFLNSTARAAIDEVPRDLPYGSMIIAELYPIKGDDTVAESIMIAGFYKVKGSTARYNDWVSFAYTPDGAVYDDGSGPVFGTETNCYSCHEAAENDYIWIDSPKYDVEHTQMPQPVEPEPSTEDTPTQG